MAKFAESEKLLNEIAQQQGGTTHLPALKVEMPSWIELIREKFREFQQWLDEGIRKLFGDLFGISIDYDQLNLGYWLLVACGMSLLGLVAWAIYRSYRKSSSHHSPAPLRFQSPIIRGKGLDELLRACQQRGDWQMAARLLWKRFLQQTGTSSETTPLEYHLICLSADEPLPKLTEQTITDSYRLMFSIEANPEEAFKRLAQSLGKREKGSV